MRKLLGIVAVLTLFTSTHAVYDYSVERCSVGGKLQELNTIPDTSSLTIYKSLAFTCSGRLATVEFFASNTGSFFLGLWRPQTQTQTWTLIGRFEVTAETTGYQELEIGMMERFTVLAGDTLGIHYGPGATAAVISVESTAPGTTPTPDIYLEEKLAESTTFQGDESGLKNGDTRDMIFQDYKEIPALRAKLQGPTTNYRLQGGPNSHSGRAEVFLDEEWGTICDRWFEDGGWPNLFCFELGFPGAARAAYTSEMGARAAATAPIHMESPRCKPSQNITMFSCSLHSNGACDHKLDVFVECNPKVRLLQGTVTTEGKNTIATGVPLVYVDGYWGTICDYRSPKVKRMFWITTWVRGFCSQLGYNQVGSPGAYAVESITNYTPDYPIVMHNPRCNKRRPYNMDECPTGPIDHGCNREEDYFITCIFDYDKMMQKREQDGMMVNPAIADAEREAKEKEAREKAERDKAEREKAERERREKAERDKADRLAAHKEAQDKAARDKAAMQAEREAAAKEARERAEREKAARDAERAAAIKAAKEKADKEKADREAALAAKRAGLAQANADKEAAKAAKRARIAQNRAAKEAAKEANKAAILAAQGGQ